MFSVYDSIICFMVSSVKDVSCLCSVVLPFLTCRTFDDLCPVALAREDFIASLFKNLNAKVSEEELSKQAESKCTTFIVVNDLNDGFLMSQKIQSTTINCNQEKLV